jgi:sulfite reductase (NADPH) flavoprotein alpha-component
MNLIMRPLCLITSLLFLFASTLLASPRYSDPEGCLSCHAYQGLNFIDDQGVFRSASIDSNHYASSLHGSVPCKDCHRKVVDYPHKVENTEVDCSASCHIEEPSEGVKYSHNVIHEEMDKSVHADGWYKGLTGGNRLEELVTEQDPSCRRCHSNTAYIAAAQLDKFKAAFDHAETECGNCHQGKAWMGQFGGHILRRFVGRRWNNIENNQFCIQCHGDIKAMQDVQQEDLKTQKKHPPSQRFIQSSKSYRKTLHGRLIDANSDFGASCIDCHAPDGWKHEIRAYTDKKSASHPDNLAASCGQSNCHAYAKKPGNEGFTMTDMHRLSLVGLHSIDEPLQNTDLWASNWFRSTWPLMIIAVVFVLGSLIWWLFYRTDKKIVAILGGNRFERVMIGRKPRKPKIKKASVFKKEPNSALAEKSKQVKPKPADDAEI